MAFQKGLKGVYGFCKYPYKKEYQDIMQALPMLQQPHKLQLPMRRLGLLFYEYQKMVELAQLTGCAMPPLPLVSQSILAVLADTDASNFCGLDLLQAFRCNVFGIKWSAYSYTTHEARQITGLDMPLSLMRSARLSAQAELLSILTGKSRKDRRVDISTGNYITRRKITDSETKTMEKLQKLACRYPSQVVMMRYHHQQRAIRMTEQLKNRNLELIKKTYARCRKDYMRDKAAGKITDKQKNYFYEDAQYFHDLLLHTTPFYDICTDSARLKPYRWPHLTSVPREIRQAFYDGCIDLDLASIQLAILVRFLHLQEWEKLLIDLRNKGQKIWSYLIAQLPANTIPDDKLKKIIKTAIYSLCFSAGNKTIYEPFYVEILDEHERKAIYTAFRTNQYIVTLFAATQQWIQDRIASYQDINNDRSYTQSIVYAAHSRSDFACKAQYAEQQIMAGIYKEATAEAQKKCPKWYIQLNCYDGVIISIKDRSKTQQIIDRLQNRVAVILTNYNIISGLEHEHILQPSQKTQPVGQSQLSNPESQTRRITGKNWQEKQTQVDELRKRSQSDARTKVEILPENNTEQGGEVESKSAPIPYGK